MALCSVSYDAYGVMLSFVVALVNAFTAVQYSEQWRYSRRKGNKDLARSLLRLMSFAIGGGIWSMHFTGMKAMRLQTADGELLQVRYGTWLTIFSFVSALMCTHLGALIASKDKYFHALNHTAKLMEDLQRKSMMQLQNRKTIFNMALFSDLHHLALGGCCTGGGVLIMHYLGMLAQDMDADIEWDVGLILLSIFIACFAATAAFWLVFRLLVFKRQYETPRFVSALTMAAAVCGMHYTGMAAGKLTYAPKDERMPHTMTADPLTWFAQVWTLGTVMLGFSMVTHDLRRLRVAAAENSGASAASVVTNASQGAATRSASKGKTATSSRSKGKGRSSMNKGNNVSVQQRLKQHGLAAVAPDWETGNIFGSLPSSQQSSVQEVRSIRSSGVSAAGEAWGGTTTPGGLQSEETSTLFVPDSLSKTHDRYDRPGRQHDESKPHSRQQQEDSAGKQSAGRAGSHAAARLSEEELQVQEV